MSTTAPTHPPTEEIDPLVSFIPVAGPPAWLLTGPLVLAGLLVAGPFVLMLTLVAVVALAVAVAVAAGFLLASPYLLVRHFRARRPAVPAPATTSRAARSRVQPSPRRVVA
jgi:hypothetical protein